MILGIDKKPTSKTRGRVHCHALWRKIEEPIYNGISCFAKYVFEVFFLQYVVKKMRIKLVYYKNYNQFCSRNHDILNARIVP